MSQPTLNDIYNRAVDQIAGDLDGALRFLSDYENLKLQNLSIADERYIEIAVSLNLFYAYLQKAHDKTVSFLFLFIGSDYYHRMLAISDGTLFEFHCLFDALDSINETRAIITEFVVELRSGEWEYLVANIKEAA
jgi:hypothetical protein